VPAPVPYETITVDVADHIARITLDRPQARNALNGSMIAELLDVLERAKADDDVRVVVLTGAGDKAFCAGADLADLAASGGPPRDGGPPDGGPPDGGPSDGGPPEGGAAGAGSPVEGSLPYRLFTAFPRLGKPVIARLAGHALAGGLGLALSCDIVIAADDVKLGTPEVNVGLWPMMIMAIINRHVAPQQAMKLYYTGQPVRAAEAVRLGLVTEAVPRASLDDRVTELAELIAAKSPIGLRTGRDAFFAIEGRPFDEQVAHLLARLTELTGTDDAKEGITAFLEKRPPRFTGR
jgi:enoyl-CoA hydratase/carnithine racemase